MIREMLLGDPARLRHIVRFSNCRRIHNESVAEHSFYTALYALLIGQQVGGCATDRLLMKAIVHDLEEAKTGDIPRPFKHSSKMLSDQIEGRGLIALDEMLTELCGHTPTMVMNNWMNSKDNTRDGCVVAFADFLSVLGYIAQEIKGSNVMMREHLETMRDYIGMFDAPDFEFLRVYVEEARELLEEVLQ